MMGWKSERSGFYFREYQLSEVNGAACWQADRQCLGKSDASPEVLEPIALGNRIHRSIVAHA
jgi:hypothetical protein